MEPMICFSADATNFPKKENAEIGLISTYFFVQSACSRPARSGRPAGVDLVRGSWDTLDPADATLLSFR
jgi:hypothetical protein